MAKGESKLTARLLVTVGEGEHVEIGTFDIPVIMRMPSNQARGKAPTVTLDVPDLRPALARALRDAADEIDGSNEPMVV
ncbi:MAG: hypothetical protein WED09_07280 [Homoserinimonas sp.]